MRQDTRSCSAVISRNGSCFLAKKNVLSAIFEGEIPNSQKKRLENQKSFKIVTKM